MASRGSQLGALGEPLTRFHPEALTRVQQRIFAVSGGPASRWGAYLAGGTALALYFGHRRSDDFDWFTPNTIPPAVLLADVETLGFAIDVHQNTEGTFLGLVAGVQFSVFRYRYELLAPTIRLDGCQLASLRDLAAMKLAALCGRATKKDYVDVRHEIPHRRSDRRGPRRWLFPGHGETDDARHAQHDDVEEREGPTLAFGGHVRLVVASLTEIIDLARPPRSARAHRSPAGEGS